MCSGNKWYKVKYLGNNGKRAIFFKTLIIISRINKNYFNCITSHETAQFYSVATFTGKNHFKLIHNDMKGVSARAYSTNYFQRLTLEALSTDTGALQLIQDKNETDKRTSSRRILLTTERSKPTNEDGKLFFCTSILANTIKA